MTVEHVIFIVIVFIDVKKDMIVENVVLNFHQYKDGNFINNFVKAVK